LRPEAESEDVRDPAAASGWSTPAPKPGVSNRRGLEKGRRGDDRAARDAAPFAGLASFRIELGRGIPPEGVGTLIELFSRCQDPDREGSGCVRPSWRSLRAKGSGAMCALPDSPLRGRGAPASVIWSVRAPWGSRRGKPLRECAAMWAAGAEVVGLGVGPGNRPVGVGPGTPGHGAMVPYPASQVEHGPAILGIRGEDQ